MGLMKLLRFRRRERNGQNYSEAVCDLGGGDIRGALHFQPAGDDAYPLPSDRAVGVPGRGSGSRASVGWFDPNNAQTAKAGEKRIYSRSEGGEQRAQVWLQNDGTVECSNDSGKVEIAADGTITQQNDGGTMTIAPDGSITITNGTGNIAMDPAGIVTINGATIDTAGLITSPTGIVAPSAVINGVETADHNHAQGDDSGGNSEQPTGPMQ